MWQEALWGVVIFILTALCGKFGMQILRRLQVGQEVRDEGPKSHFVKSGTPTFGGLFFFIPLLLSAIYRLISLGKLDVYIVSVLLALVFGAVGFADDFIKVRVNKDGLSVKQKILFLGIASLAFSVWYLWLAPFEPSLRLPFSGNVWVISGAWKYLALVLIVGYLFYISNSVNIADGVDGLCSSLTLVTMIFYLIAAWKLKESGANFDAPGTMALSFAMMGAVLGFLIYNHHPAQVFMGDTGSLAIGAIVAAIPLLMGAFWFVLLAGFVFIIEGLSVLLQVSYFKMTGGKRIFRMAPLHHHYELGGWNEWKIVGVFSLVAAIFGALGLLIL